MKTIRDICIILCITLSLMLCFELYLRLSSPALIEDPNAEAGFEFNREYLIKLKPSIKKTYQRSELNGLGRIVWRTNKDGFRGDELRGIAGPRVMVYGDSNIQARFVSLEDTFPARLGDELRSAYSKEIEVINAGVVGFGPDQYLLKFKEDAGRYKPDLVIFAFYADNDYGDIIRNRLFTLDEKGNLKRNPHKTTPDSRLENRERKGLHASIRILDWAKEKKSAMMLKKAFKGGSTGMAGALQREFSVYKLGLPRVFSNFEDHYDFDMALFPDREASRVKGQLADALLKESKRVADSLGVAFMVMIIPSNRDISENAYPNHTHFKQYDGYDNRRLSRVAADILKKNNIKGVDLFDTFASNDPAKLYFLGVNDHWNEAGQGLAAKVVSEYIFTEELL